MSYNNMRFDRGYARQNMGAVQTPWNPQYANAPRTNRYGQYRKKSGAKITEGSNGKPAITAWRKTRNAFMTLVACPNNEKHIARKDGGIPTNKKGQQYARWTATLVERNTGTMTTHSALYNLTTGKLYLPDLKLVVNPRANNGGYFGKSYVSRR